MQDIREARATFFARLDGELVKVNRGDLLRIDHPLYEGREHLFRPVTVRFETAVQDEVRSLDLSHMIEEIESVSEEMSLEELKNIAHGEGLATYGAKPALVERINKKRGV